MAEQKAKMEPPETRKKGRSRRSWRDDANEAMRSSNMVEEDIATTEEGGYWRRRSNDNCETICIYVYICKSLYNNLFLICKFKIYTTYYITYNGHNTFLTFISKTYGNKLLLTSVVLFHTIIFTSVFYMQIVMYCDCKLLTC